jgi:hypothetical protein
MVKNPFINERCLKNNPYVKSYGCYYCKKTNPNPYTTDNNKDKSRSV